ncbi:uncharacterized protein LOC110907801 [Helianthus annuus]|uniref:uncharacterized protein LOC110907801 n=1 Tax=Helianthus annuus TaxID=4232 RepID=UPI000B9016AF|nr:uncharacterized protein LOC110907801 [Helianthus annuus]
MADELPLWFPPDSSDDSSNISILFFFQNLIEDAELQETGTSNRRRYIERQREVGRETLMADYFDEDPKYNDDIFRHRFRMSKRLFLKIVNDVEENEWFQEALDARGSKGFTPLQKVTSAIKQLAIGNTPDENDEYLHTAERTSRECLEYFCDTVCKIYAPEFLRRPTSHDMTLLYEAHEEKTSPSRLLHDVNVEVFLLFLVDLGFV